MARTRNPEAHTIRREAFVEAAQRLIQSRGFEQMSVQDVLDELEASRGAFYHYFDSKLALLEAVVDRLVDDGMALVEPILSDPTLSAIEKLHYVFAGIARWKSQRKELVLALVEVWMSDDNAIVREKVRHIRQTRLGPVLSVVIRQGVEEGLFTVTSPDDAATVLIAVLDGVSDAATHMFIARQANTIAYETVKRATASWTEAFERILGSPAGSLTLIDEPTLREWFG
jgi:AcrR family transcriptional regulator